MDRFFLPPSEWKSEKPVLKGEEAHHCARVMRKQVGDRIEVFDGEGAAAEAEILVVSKREIGLCLKERRFSEQSVKVVLAVGVPKGKLMEAVIQKAVELGVNEIVPLMTDQGTVRIDDEEAGKKGEKWQRVALEACKQCGQNFLPAVRPVSSVDQCLAERTEETDLLIGALAGEPRPLGVVLQQLFAKEQTPPSVMIMVGPEGDFSEAEYERIFAGGAIPVSLGPLILRVETAVTKLLAGVRIFQEAS